MHSVEKGLTLINNGNNNAFHQALPLNTNHQLMNNRNSLTNTLNNGKSVPNSMEIGSNLITIIPNQIFHPQNQANLLKPPSPNVVDHDCKLVGNEKFYFVVVSSTQS